MWVIIVKAALLNWCFFGPNFPFVSVYMPTELLISLITTKYYLLPKTQALGEGTKLCVQGCVGSEAVENLWMLSVM